MIHQHYPQKIFYKINLIKLMRKLLNHFKKGKNKLFKFFNCNYKIRKYEKNIQFAWGKAFQSI